MIEALSVSSEQDLQPLSQYLTAMNIYHRISEQASQQIIWVDSDADAAQVETAYQLYQQGQLPSQPAVWQTTIRHQSSSFELVWSRLRVVPVISLMIAVSIITTALIYTQFGNGVFGLMRMGTLDYMLNSGQLWRAITPIFLHFGLMHLAFNMVLLWAFGRQLELRENRPTLLLLLLLFAVIPNFAQYLASGINFGGMSGLVYAVLGYCWLLNRLSAQPLFFFPPALMGLMVVWLLIGFSGLLTIFDFPSMANVAHLAGLLIGLAAAAVMAAVRRV